ncbi:MAG: 2-oxoglutarate dehydrogenase E1 component, partial [Bacteroidota bacterium]
PANFFHAMRRQLARPFRKPLVVMSPKSLLRHPQCVSDISDFEDKKDQGFQEYYDDAATNSRNQKKVKRVVLCTGKVYYDLLAKKEADKRDDVALVRVEQLYPFPKKQIDDLLNKKYKNAERMWVQEEPANMGAWQHIQNIYPCDGFILTSRKPSASPATGFKKVHDMEQAELVEKAFMFK